MLYLWPTTYFLERDSFTSAILLSARNEHVWGGEATTPASLTHYLRQRRP